MFLQVGKLKDQREINARWYSKHKEFACEKSRKRYADRRYGRFQKMSDAQRFRHLITAAKSNAKKYGVPFSITANDLEVPDLCPILLIPLRFTGPPFSPNLPSLDRIRPGLGYVKGNVRVISWRANRLKADCVDPAELRAIADYMEKNMAETAEFFAPMTRQLDLFNNNGDD